MDAEVQAQVVMRMVRERNRNRKGKRWDGEEDGEDQTRAGWERDIDGAVLSGIPMNVALTRTLPVGWVVVRSEDIMT